jgi:hypothetical protein
MALGTAGGILTGLSMPAFMVLFGRIINTLNSDSGSFTQSIAELCISLVVVAGINVISGFLQVSNSDVKAITEHVYSTL